MSLIPFEPNEFDHTVVSTYAIRHIFYSMFSVISYHHESSLAVFSVWYLNIPQVIESSKEKI